MTSYAAPNPTTSGGPKRAALVAGIGVAGIAVVTLAGAWFFQLVLGLVPCPLCLEQRYAYYLAVPLAATIAIAASRGASSRLLGSGLVLLAIISLVNAGLGTYHAGVEWTFWQGPTGCSGPMLDLSSGSLLESIKTAKVVRCDEVQWRFLGLSLAGYNVLISLAMVAVAGWGAVRSFRAR